MIDQIQELNNKVCLHNLLKITNISRLSLDYTNFLFELQGSVMHQENIELYNKVNLLHQDNIELRRKVHASGNSEPEKDAASRNHFFNSAHSVYVNHKTSFLFHFPGLWTRGK